MAIYKKPIVLLNEELSEGVYAASGVAGTVSVSGVSLVSEGNEYNKVNTYNVTIKNDSGFESSDWSVSISVVSGTATSATIYNNYVASASLSGSTITITPGNGGAIAAGGSLEVEVVVFYSSNSVTVA